MLSQLTYPPAVSSQVQVDSFDVFSFTGFTTAGPMLFVEGPPAIAIQGTAYASSPRAPNGREGCGGCGCGGGGGGSGGWGCSRRHLVLIWEW